VAEINFPEPKTALAVIQWYEKNHNDDHRPHLGASIIGRQCSRQIWYSWHWADKKQVPGRLAKLFERGHLEEPVMAKALRGIGVELHTAQPDGSQWTVSLLGGHFGGSKDGVGIGFPEAPKSWAIWENKTSNTKKYNEMLAKGLKAAKPEHYDQMQVYMGASGIDRGMYTMVCKETDDVYSEWVRFDKDRYEQLLAKAEIIIRAAEPPTGVSKDPSYYICKMCDFAHICHGGKAPEVNCRTCLHSTAELDGTDGRWSCARWRSDVPLEAQKTGCDEHRYIPAFFDRQWKCEGEGNGDIYYSADNGDAWINGQNGLTSHEIRALESIDIVDAACATKQAMVHQGFLGAKVIA